MTVDQLIQELMKFDGSAEAVIPDRQDDDSFSKIRSISFGCGIENDGEKNDFVFIDSEFIPDAEFVCLRGVK